MGGVLGLGVGLGLVLIWSAFARPRTARPLGEARAGRPGGVDALLRSAGFTGMAPGLFLLICAVCGAASGLIVAGLSRALPVGVLAGVAIGGAPVALLRARARHRHRGYAEAWPDAIDDMASAVRAGLSLPEALAGLAVRGPEPLREACAAFSADFAAGGRFSDCLDRLKERLADPVGDRVVEGLRVAREVGGGDLGRLLRNLSGYLREDARTRGELEARQAWVVNGARVAVAAPWLVLGFLSFQPGVMHRYASPGGALIVAFGAGCCALAYWLMLRVGRLPQERRVWG